jgi:thiol-disulfide isomerase/thioredoxin
MVTYYQALQKESLCKAASFVGSENGIAALKFIMDYRTFIKAKSKEGLEKTTFYQNVPLICNDTLKGLYVATYMGGLKDYESVINYVAPYQQYFYDSATRKAYELKKASFSPYAKGTIAYNFALKDQHDKIVRLSDYKGKIVVMDMWAMWCAPCLQEKPIFKQIEESYKSNPDIVFLGLSVDGAGKKDGWKAFIIKKGWNEGTELLSEPNEDISKYYQIEGIPRFFIFDKEGKIVTVDAPRPSDPAFKQLIEQTLAASSK